MSDKANMKRMAFVSIPDPFKDLEGGSEFLYQARDALYVTFRTGEAKQCPCCGHTVKCYARPISASDVKALRTLAARHGAVASQDIIDKVKTGGGGTHSVLKHWGLVESPKHNAWRITELGRNFLAGNVMVPKYVYLYRDQKLAESIERVDVNNCKGVKFDLSETMDPGTGANKEIT